MYLKNIRIFGFKSFADKIDIEIKKGITAIVGPNGSGKSNIVDAVRWVLGEQSSKSLRSFDMSDVIFSGSKTRSGLTRAYVALLFDNTDHYLNSSFDEVEVKRVIYQTGENEYYINNSKVRLKDITDLFLDTGSGVDSFNIISQGSVADIISSKPEARRTIFEDAAGVLKYKKRKEISLKKLDKTKENLASIKLVIDELEKSVKPLEKQSIVAKKYLALKEELKSIEIALIATDIKNINLDYQKIKIEVESLEKDLAKLETDNSADTAKLEKLKFEDLKLDEAITLKNNELIKLTENLASLEAEKLVTVERQKYETKADYETILIKLKEEELNLNKEITVERKALEDINLKLKELKDKKDNLDHEILKLKIENDQNNAYLNEYTKTIMTLENKIEILQDNILNNTKVPLAVKSIINNERLKGVHNTIGSLIECDSLYLTALDVALGYAANFIIVDNEIVSKECIQYLKANNLGRATFFPLNIIKPRSIALNELNEVKKVSGFIDCLANLIKYDRKYANIMENQLGNVLVVRDVDTLNTVAKLVNYKYKIVSLEGEILQPGGSITGGSLKMNNSLAQDKLNLNKWQEELKINQTKLEVLNNNLNEKRKKFLDLSQEAEEMAKQIINQQELENTKNKNLEKLEDELNHKILEIKGNEDLKNNKLDQKLLSILEEIKDVASEKDIVKLALDKLKQQKSELTVEINELNNSYHKVNQEHNRLQNLYHNKQVELGKYDVKLDNLLLTLSQNYQMTHEYATSNYELDLPIDMARLKVESLKKEMQKLGEVNTGSIAEFERINERYNFLIKQSQDLEMASKELIDIISDMDKIMIERFKTTFEAISKEFNITFKKLFKGGRGSLKLTNPNDLLNTGIDIEAEPPGKKLNSITLLSGGEKTLTAIATLFAIINVKPSPFCILDEVEAALDEANVDTFGKYLQEKKDKSQFILITHKKRTMEYADVLYGLTMQESGVSKIVSVNLENM